MRTARPPPHQNPKRSPHGGLRVHLRLVQPPSPPFRPRLSFTDQLRKDSANTKSNRKPNTVHRNGFAPIRVRWRLPSPRMRATASLVLSYRIERGTPPKNSKLTLCPSQKASVLSSG